MQIILVYNSIYKLEREKFLRPQMVMWCKRDCTSWQSGIGIRKNNLEEEP